MFCLWHLSTPRSTKHTLMFLPVLLRYAAANATFDFLNLSYIAEKIQNIDFAKPIKLQMDNTTAESFTKNTGFRSKLKHINRRQHWVKVVRNTSILVAEHVNTKDNVADVFTKILNTNGSSPG
jgi:hypothetical protein